MDFIIVSVLALLGVGTVLIFVIKALLDLMPDLFASWHRAVAAYKGDVAEPSPVPEAGEGKADVYAKSATPASGGEPGPGS